MNTLNLDNNPKSVRKQFLAWILLTLTPSFVGHFKQHFNGPEKKSPQRRRDGKLMFQSEPIQFPSQDLLGLTKICMEFVWMP